MNTLLLVGTPAAGKTTFASIVKYGKAPDKYIETDVDEIRKGRLIKKTILDTGGLERNDELKYRKWIDESKKICFFFDGIKFLNEIENFYEGGEISSKISFYVLKPKIEKGYDGKEEGTKKPFDTTKLFFIATHDDEFVTFKQNYIKEHGAKKFEEVFGNSNDMRSAIIARLKSANREYAKLCGTNRYAFSTLFGGVHFLCINTTDKRQTLEAYKQIIDFRFK